MQPWRSTHLQSKTPVQSLQPSIPCLSLGCPCLYFCLCCHFYHFGVYWHQHSVWQNVAVVVVVFDVAVVVAFDVGAAFVGSVAGSFVVVVGDEVVVVGVVGEDWGDEVVVVGDEVVVWLVQVLERE